MRDLFILLVHLIAGVCALFMRPARVLRSAVVLRPATILEFHRMLRRRKYRWDDRKF